MRHPFARRDPMRLVIGSWSAGERWLTLPEQARPTLAWTWLHFEADGEVCLSMRHADQQQAEITHGRWWLDGGHLVLNFGRGVIRAEYSVDHDVMYWAGEVLVRLPDDLPRQAWPVASMHRRAAASPSVT